MHHTVIIWATMMVLATTVSAGVNNAWLFTGTLEDCEKETWTEDDYAHAAGPFDMDAIHIKAGTGAKLNLEFLGLLDSGCISGQPADSSARNYVWVPNIQTGEKERHYCLTGSTKPFCTDSEETTNCLLGPSTDLKLDSKSYLHLSGPVLYVLVGSGR